MKLLITVYTCTFLLAMGIAVGIDSFNNRDKFKVGDCIFVDYSGEFEEDIRYYKVLKIGKVEYLMAERYDESEGYNYGDVSEPKSEFNVHRLANADKCPSIKDNNEDN